MGSVLAMKLLVAMLAVLAPASSLSADAVSVFECRKAGRVTVSMPVIRSEEDKRISFARRSFEPNGAKLFGLPVSFLSETISGPDADKNFNDFEYTAIVNGKIDEVRWLVERANPDLRCIRIPANGISDGNSHSCLLVGKSGTKDRNVSLYPANGDDHLNGIKEGVVVSCSFNDLPD
jgi:hypothetical protein